MGRSMGTFSPMSSYSSVTERENIYLLNERIRDRENKRKREYAQADPLFTCSVKMDGEIHGLN